MCGPCSFHNVAQLLQETEVTPSIFGSEERHKGRYSKRLPWQWMEMGQECPTVTLGVKGNEDMVATLGSAKAQTLIVKYLWSVQQWHIVDTWSEQGVYDEFVTVVIWLVYLCYAALLYLVSKGPLGCGFCTTAFLVFIYESLLKAPSRALTHQVKCLYLYTLLSTEH